MPHVSCTIVSDGSRRTDHRVVAAQTTLHPQPNHTKRTKCVKVYYPIHVRAAQATTNRPALLCPSTDPAHRSLQCSCN
jgi:hypothetical protein